MEGTGEGAEEEEGKVLRERGRKEQRVARGREMAGRRGGERQRRG